MAFSARDLIPVYGTMTATLDVLEDYDSGKISLAEAQLEISAVAAFSGTVFGMTFVHLPSIGTTKAVAAIAPKLPAIAAATALVVATRYVTAPSADVEHGPFGTVRVTPRLGFLG